MNTRCITAYVIAAIIFWWNVYNSTTLILQPSNDDDYATSDVTSSSNSTISDNSHLNRPEMENYLPDDLHLLPNRSLVVIMGSLR